MAQSLDLAERGAAQIPDAKKQCEAYLAVAEVCAATGERNGYLRCIKAAPTTAPTTATPSREPL